jgi:hypothetical protein
MCGEGGPQHALEDEIESDIFMCGMQPLLVEGSPCHSIFQRNPNLSCNS